MRKQRKIRKEDIGDPSNFRHVEHVGFGGKKSSVSTLQSLHNQSQSLDLETGDRLGEDSSGENSPQIQSDRDHDSFAKVERRSRGSTSRSSLIPRHHRSTTTCIFPEAGAGGGSAYHLQNHFSIQSNSSKDGGRLGRKARNKDNFSPEKETQGSLKPTFGSLLNLSFLPLGLGNKSSQKSPSIAKTHRMSLLNLTASNLFSGGKSNNGGGNDDEKEAVMMTGYTRRRSFSNSRDSCNQNEEGTGTIKKKPSPKIGNPISNANNKLPEVPVSKENSSTEVPRSELRTNSPPPKPTRIPLAKLGRSKSSMSEVTKRPKLRLKIVPPVAPPPPIPPRSNKVVAVPTEDKESLPSPPPSPLPSPPTTPTSAPPIPPQPPTLEEEENASKIILRRSPKCRTRIIQLPASSSGDSLDHGSPQYLTPVGGSSPLLSPRRGGSLDAEDEEEGTKNQSMFPLLSPTIPPTSTPILPPQAGRKIHPATPPVWPLQPVWPSLGSLQLQQTQPTIAEVPSPSKEEMEVVENEYDPVASIVDSFISDEEEKNRTTTDCPIPSTEQNCELMVSRLCRDSLQTVFRRTEKLFQALSTTDKAATPEGTNRIKSFKEEMLGNTFRLWLEMSELEGVDRDRILAELAKIFEDDGDSMDLLNSMKN